MHTSRKAAPLLGLATLAALCLASFSLSARPVAAQATVFSTFGPGNSFGPVVYGESGPSSPSGTISQGAAFSPSATGALSTVTAAYAHFNGTDDAHFYLTDMLGNLGKPAASLESFVFTPPAFPGAVVSLPSALRPVLTAGQTYYLYDLEPADEINGWNFSSPPVLGTRVASTAGQPYTSSGNQQLPAFSIQEANPAITPESSGLANLSGAMLALALAGAVTAMKKRKPTPAASGDPSLRRKG